MITLRPYQNEAVDSLLDFWLEGRSNGLIVAPCGAGKSLIIADIIKRCLAIDEDVRIIVLAHRRKLLEQNAAELSLLHPGANYGFYSAGLNRKDKDKNILFASIQTIAKQVTKFEPWNIILIDEAHLIPNKTATQYGHFLHHAKLMNPYTRMGGLTATPYRLDSGHLVNGGLFDKIVYDIKLPFLIEKGYLCPVISKGGTDHADLSNVHKRGGDFILSEMAAAFDQKELTNRACDEIASYGRDRKAWLIFCASVAHAEHVTDALKDRGIDCALVHAKTPRGEQDKLFADFKAGRLRCLVNVDLLTVGSNFPICDMGVLLRSTESAALYVQIVGRLMRTHPGKTNALLLDYGQNVERLGPIDAVRVKSKGAGGEGEAPAKECPECKSVVHAGLRQCPDCGHEFPPPEVVHAPTAYSGAVMAEQIQPEWVQVFDVTYKRHKKKGKPDSLKITYFCGIRGVRAFSQWVCIEHTGAAKYKASLFLNKIGSKAKTVTDALNECNEWPSPDAIQIKPNGKYTDILNIQYCSEKGERHAS